jgi:hypothetical protein
MTGTNQRRLNLRVRRANDLAEGGESKLASGKVGSFLMSAAPATPVETEVSAQSGDGAALERVMREVPRGALALAGLAVGLLLLAWIITYVFIFLPRGMVG